MAEHAGSGAAAHPEWEDASSQTQAAPGDGSPRGDPQTDVRGVRQCSPWYATRYTRISSVSSGGPSKTYGWKRKRLDALGPQMPVPPAYTHPYLAMSQLRWEQDVYGHWWYSDGQHWWYGHGGSHHFTAPPAGPIPTATSGIGASWQFVNPETVKHPSGPKQPREPAHPPAPHGKKPPKPEHPTRRNRLPRARSRQATCKDCKLRKVLYYSTVHGAMAATAALNCKTVA